MKSNKGITLIMLVITVVVLAILAGTAINVGYSSYKNAELTGYVTTMNMIQSRVNVINKKIAEGNTSYDTVGIELTDLDAATQEKINVAVNGQTIQGFKYYGKEQLELLGISNIEEEVIINLETREIYSLVPIEYEDVKHYNQYNLPNGIKLIEYSGLTTVAPEFTIEKDNYGLTTTVNITNIIYDEQINGSDIYYGEVTDSTTEPVTVSYWQLVEGTSFSVTKTATYAVKMIDRNGGETIKTVEVVTCNSPELTEGMVPVIYENGNWKKVSDNEIGKWYDYAEGKWANVMLSDGLEIAEDGSITTMGSMFVWIPRYSYQITSNYHNGGEGISGNINVKFLKDISYVTTDETTTKMINSSGEGNWNVHPAFTDGSENNYANGGWDRELTGFWVAKFEASSSSPELDYGGGNVTNLNVKVIPNVTSWRYITISNIFTNCLNMNAEGNIYGIPTNAVTHLMKNSEWGAVAYLTQSKYGRNGTEVTVNNSSTYITGNAANSVSEAENAGGVANAYNTEKGVLATTTGTVYGIYDMSGGAGEYVSAGLTTKIDEEIKILNGFEEKLVDRYKQAENEDSGNGNYTILTTRYGDAIYETSAGAWTGVVGTNFKSWNYDVSAFIESQYAFLLRGSNKTRKENTGIYSFGREAGTEYDWAGFRPTIVVE